MKLLEHPRIKQGLKYYRQMESRDRFALNGLAVFFAVLFVYFGLWTPVNNYREESQMFRDRQLSLLQYMQQSEQRARQVAANSGQASVEGQTLLTRVSNTAQQNKIKPNRLQPEGNDSVSVWFDQVPFNDLIRWLRQLTVQQGVDIRQISIDRQDRPGTVNARIVLSG
ncbi:MAG: type II secretion system protein M [Pseudomonadales bacterium]|nr:type II secretion system protein M [Pseudomonadales bacterium]